MVGEQIDCASDRKFFETLGANLVGLVFVDQYRPTVLQGVSNRRCFPIIQCLRRRSGDEIDEVLHADITQAYNFDSTCGNQCGNCICVTVLILASVFELLQDLFGHEEPIW